MHIQYMFICKNFYALCHLTSNVVIHIYIIYTYMYIYICVCKMYVYAQILQYIFTINVKSENQVFPVVWLYKLTRINFFFFCIRDKCDQKNICEISNKRLHFFSQSQYDNYDKLLISISCC